MALLRDYLAHTALREYSFNEQKELLDRMVWDGVRAGDLRVEETVPLLREHFPDISSGDVAQLFLMMSELTGQELSCAHLAHRMKMQPRHVLKFLALCERAGIWFHLNCFDRASDEIGDKSKGYMVESGVAAEFLGVQNSGGLREHPRWGALFETFIIARLKALVFHESIRLHYWRTTHGDAEVDAVLEGDGWLYPIEIKSTQHAVRSNAKKIRIFRAYYEGRFRIAPGLVVYAGNENYRFDDETIAVSWRSLWEEMP